jgi:hypothetical protein
MPMVINGKNIDVSISEQVDPTLYKKLIGSLMYLVNTRPNICFVVHILNQFMVEPRREQWVATKHVLRYLCGTVEYVLIYILRDGVKLMGFIDADWEGNTVDRKITSGCCFNLGS